MELRHIRYFLAIAEEKNFTRAASKLHIAQPPLSQQIKDLEYELGTPLFHRTPHGAELTDAGAAFFEAVKVLPLQIRQAKEAAQKAAKGETGKLRLGVTGTAALHPAIPAVIRQFRRRYPEVELTIEEANSLALAQGMLTDRLDAAILRPSDPDPKTLTIEHFLTEQLVIALPSAHPLARDTNAINMLALQQEPFIMTPRSLAVSLHDAVVAVCHAAGFEPIEGQAAPQIASILSMVSAELGISLVPESMRQLSVKGVVFRSIGDTASKVELAVAYPSLHPSQPALNFAAVVRQQKSAREALLAE
ncbi:LysR substrate-binding domain-containing protein [Shewanella fodinae]|uniref:LysR substrate-binding domain-containing protein n=1 Tax=Shewanella fodinae TaxID=552357 RepID=UPI001677A7B6|nr:LysR substrate-binding domain-containing protein [Shewanella fodinae]MCL2905844.1 LysR substrate-binding domain-containing protein [Shewanella fodinae]GGY96615.1 LysR family transcriptional regulator [Shewanella fodinae]